jgi:hypothetical protein
LIEIVARDGRGGDDRVISVSVSDPPPAPSGLSLAVAADKGASGDTIKVTGKGVAGDRVTLLTA